MCPEPGDEPDPIVEAVILLGAFAITAMAIVLLFV